MPRRRERGVTLIEALMVTALIGLMAGIVFPSVSAGIDSLRISGAADSIAGFFTQTLNRVERRQQPLEIRIVPEERLLRVRSMERVERTLELPEGVRILAILPRLPEDATGRPAPRRVFIYPNGTVPRLGVELVNSRGQRRIVRVDPITGVPRVERPDEEKP